ncbi:MAG TPA: patatin-like phospholipase family protein [Myxococcales bacterium]|nr:patatin-like phospholipase family protein [Myxococcales bacterium]
MRLQQRFEVIRPLEEMEVALVRASARDPALVTPPEETVVRTALSLARLYRVPHQGREVGVGAFLEPFRNEVRRRLEPLLLDGRPVRRDALAPLLPWLKEETLRRRDALVKRTVDRLPPEAIDKEIREKALVLVAGGGGGTGYVYLGVMSTLDEFGLRPKLMAATSIGAILCLFRARMERFDHTEMVNIVRGLSWRKLFRVISMDSRYGLPAALRLFLRAGIGRYFSAGEADGQGLRLKDLPVPMLIPVSGIRRGMLPHPVEFYEGLLNLSARSFFEPAAVARKVQEAMGAVAELFLRPEIMMKLTLGEDDATGEFDALDAAGFSSALPGVIHYDVLKENGRMSQLLDHLFESRGLLRLIDGGLTDNLPAKAAWRAVHKGRIGTRNAFILALNGFSPKLTTPLWLPLQRLAALTAAPNRPYAHLVKDFKRTLSPLELVPSVDLVGRAMELGRQQIQDEMPFICRMLAPLPRLMA